MTVKMSNKQYSLLKHLVEEQAGRFDKDHGLTLDQRTLGSFAGANRSYVTYRTGEFHVTDEGAVAYWEFAKAEYYRKTPREYFGQKINNLLVLRTRRKVA